MLKNKVFYSIEKRHYLWPDVKRPSRKRLNSARESKSQSSFEPTSTYAGQRWRNRLKLRELELGKISGGCLQNGEFDLQKKYECDDLPRGWFMAQESGHNLRKARVCLQILLLANTPTLKKCFMALFNIGFLNSPYGLLTIKTSKFNDSNREDEVSFREKLEKDMRRHEVLRRDFRFLERSLSPSMYVEATTNDEAPVMLVFDEALATLATIIIHLPGHQAVRDDYSYHILSALGTRRQLAIFTITAMAGRGLVILTTLVVLMLTLGCCIQYTNHSQNLFVASILIPILLSRNIAGLYSVENNLMFAYVWPKRPKKMQKTGTGGGKYSLHPRPPNETVAKKRNVGFRFTNHRSPKRSHKETAARGGIRRHPGGLSARRIRLERSMVPGMYPLRFWFLVLDSGRPPLDGGPIKMETNEVGRNEVLRSPILVFTVLRIGLKLGSKTKPNLGNSSGNDPEGKRSQRKEYGISQEVMGKLLQN
ncbi:hypothetical protein WN51_07776 [Melipona quadrifasciata]|uniref:Uncharacterized protein n=1 Tax=Melipona quadrifasciata TaxID=166423 RepID=A0A0M9A921_9HYME|nr:hypothetical protein WN51_07776 [Melipona quadrifasciata]